MDETTNYFLICTVGGTAEPIVAAIKHWRPVRVYFLPTPGTAPLIETKIAPGVAAEGGRLDPGSYDSALLIDGQDFAGCVQAIRRLTPRVAAWLRRGEQFKIVVDMTGGTKCMSAALAVQAREWPCVFSYVGGTERTKEGVGVVVSGREQVLYSQNPWDALGYQAVDAAVVLFNHGVFAAAAETLRKFLRNVAQPARKAELSAVLALAEAYEAWERFDHPTATSRIADAQKRENDLAGALGRDRADALLRELALHREFLAKLQNEAGPTRERIGDLLANARRRACAGRFDDAVARLYRAIEAVAQARLAAAHGIADTKAVPIDYVPEPLLAEWSGRAADGRLMLGLQDGYALLESLRDEAGARFKALGLDDWTKSPLVARNRSILAHGFDAVGHTVFDQLWFAALELASTVGVTERDLPAFPSISNDAPP